MPKRIICTVTNDLNYDQRMQRICSTLAGAGYSVTLVGRLLPGSGPMDERPFKQHRLTCLFRKGFPFYAEYNLRLFFYLLSAKYDAVCSVDLDTLPAGCISTLIRRKKRVFDAHEYFTEVPELVNRPFVKAFWGLVARLFLPFYKQGYTVGPALAAIFAKKYRLPFAVVRNMPLVSEYAGYQAKKAAFLNSSSANKILLYQGALNEGRGIAQLLIAMQQLEGFELWLAGAGDLSVALREQASMLGVQDKVRFLGLIKPDDLKAVTAQAWLGLNLLENKGLSYYYSLANKFFDSIQAGIPVLTMDFPEYRALNAQHEVAILLKTLRPETIVEAVQRLQGDPDLYQSLQLRCRPAAQDWNWEQEVVVLLAVWREVL